RSTSREWRPGAGPEWPSARVILEARRFLTESGPGPRPKPHRADPRPVPTLGRPPSLWTLPLWSAWPLMAFAVLVAGGIGLGLSWIWARDDASAGAIAALVLRDRPSAAAEAPAVEGEPRSSWWGSTASHLFLWALAADRAVDDPDRGERVRSFLD